MIEFFNGLCGILSQYYLFRKVKTAISSSCHYEENVLNEIIMMLSYTGRHITAVLKV